MVGCFNLISFIFIENLCFFNMNKNNLNLNLKFARITLVKLSSS